MRTLTQSLFIATILICLSQAYAGDPWYVSYENGLMAIEAEQWSTAVDYFNAALSEKAEPKTNAKTYGLRFIDYLPYLYRSIAHYHLGNYEQATADLEQSRAFGEVDRASRDKSALTKLQRYSLLIEQAQQKASKKQQLQILLVAATTLLEQQDFAAAQEKVNEILLLDPDHAEAQKLMERINSERSRSHTQSSNTPPASSSADDGERENTSSVSRSVAKNEYPEKKQAELNRDALRTKPESTTRTAALFQEAVTAFEQGNFPTAETKFALLLDTSPDHAEAQDYVARISTVKKQIKSGIRAYFEGNNEKAINELTAAEQMCRFNPHLYLFLGCAYSSQYFLNGGEDEQLLQNAMANFQKVKNLDSDFQPDRRYFSPRIIALFENN